VIYFKNHVFYGPSSNSARHSPSLQSWSNCCTKLKKDGFFLYFLCFRTHFDHILPYVSVGLTQCIVSHPDVIGSNPISNNVIITIIDEETTSGWKSLSIWLYAEK
jgi:hypothetical protein